MRDYCDVTIHTAAFYGSCATVKHLIAAGTSPDGRNQEGNTPLMMAILGSAKRKDKDECVSIILDSGANVNMGSEDGEPILHMAVKEVIRKSLSKKIIEQLIDRGADKNGKDRNGLTASQFAYNEGSSKIGNLISLYVRSYSDEFLLNITRSNVMASSKWQQSFEVFSKKEHGLFAEMMSFIFPRQAFYRKLFLDIEELERQKIIRRRNSSEMNSPKISAINNPFKQDKHIRQCLSQYEEWRRIRALQRKRQLVNLNENEKDLIQFTDEEEKDGPSYYIRRKSSSKRDHDNNGSQKRRFL